VAVIQAAAVVVVIQAAAVVVVIQAAAVVVVIQAVAAAVVISPAAVVAVVPAVADRPQAAAISAVAALILHPVGPMGAALRLRYTTARLAELMRGVARHTAGQAATPGADT
jgi:hypothetical protein